MNRFGLAAACVITLSFAPSESFGQASPSPEPSPTGTPAAALTGSPAPESVDPAVTARAKEWMHRAQTATIDRTQLDDQMNALLTDSLISQVAAQVGPLGEPTAFTFVAKRRIGSDTGYRFLATFKAAKLYWIFAVNDAGKISGLRFLPAQ